MRSLAWALLLSVCFVTTAGREPARRIIEVSTAEELMAAFREPLQNVTVQLAPGTYELAFTVEVDSTLETNPVRVGLRLSGQRVQLTGADADQVVIVTQADYGVYFRDCVDCVLEHVSLINGIDDANSRLQGGAAVAVNSSVRIANCVIRDNSNPGGQGNGMAGITVRRQALLLTEFCEIVGNAETGISVCDDGHAIIKHNLLDGTGYVGNSPSEGVAVGCDGQAVIERNHIRNYGSGIGIQNAANAQVRFNIVETMRNVGIYYVDAKGTAPRAVIRSNAVYECDAGGMQVLAYSPYASNGHVRVTDNLVVGIGQRDPGRCRGALSVGNQPEDLVISDNTFFDNVPGLDRVDRNMPREIFWRARRQWTRTYRNTPVGVDGRHKFHESAFLTRYGRWMD